jgi:haloalkane dehalogenase
MDTKPSFIEHWVPRGHGRVYVREYAGIGPAFVLMRGFPDNLHIYDELIPHLVAAGRWVVTFDFLGFGASDKPASAHYSLGPSFCCRLDTGRKSICRSKSRRRRWRNA